MHELMHGLGPHTISIDGTDTTVRQQLQETHSAIEEAKADISGLWALHRLIDRGAVNKALEWSISTTFLASIFRSIRFGINEAHGLGVAIQLNTFLDSGAVTVQPSGIFTVNHEQIRTTVEELTRRLMTIQVNGINQVRSNLKKIPLNGGRRAFFISKSCPRRTSREGSSASASICLASMTAHGGDMNDMNAHLNAKHAAAHGHAGIIVAPLLACVVVPANAAMPGHYVIGPVEQHQMLVTAAPMPLAKPMKKRKLRLDQHEPMAQQRVHMPMAHPGYAPPGPPPPHLVQHAPQQMQPQMQQQLRQEQTSQELPFVLRQYILRVQVIEQ